MRVAGIVLAAGASTRMGRPKALLPAGAGTLLAACVAPHLEAGLDPVVVVLGSHAAEIQRDAGLPADRRLRVVVNPSWPEGMASSLRAGLSACREAGVEAALVALGDQPSVTRARIEALVAAWIPGAALAVPVHEGRVGHPVLFARGLWPELEALEGDIGGREVVRRHWDRAIQVPAPPLLDLDTPADYQAFRNGVPPPPDEGLLP
jgi:CTP:molybdopterin cytidylyltransferase MocA